MNDQKQKKNVAIVVPMYKTSLNEDETISMLHLHRFLGDYDRYFMSPKGLKFKFEGFFSGFGVKYFKKKFFKGVINYSELMLREEFYQAFSEYEYILIYQTDVVVFSDQLKEWCQKGYDYVGAPWFKDTLGHGYEFPDACGNGGFSLRNVEKSIKAIRMLKKPWLHTLYRLLLCVPNKIFRYKPFIFHVIKEWTESAPHRTQLLEDRYWSFEVPKYLPDFKIPSPDEGLKFSMEVGPEYCFKRNNNQLPFGSHAWAKYDRKFWEPYLLKKSDKV